MKKEIDSYIVEAVKDRSRKCLKLICIVLDGCCSSSTYPAFMGPGSDLFTLSNSIEYMLRLYCSLAVPLPARVLPSRLRPVRLSPSFSSTLGI
jgi:hypothetical protein